MKVKQRKFEFVGNLATRVFYVPLFLLFRTTGGIFFTLYKDRDRSVKKLLDL